VTWGPWETAGAASLPSAVGCVVAAMTVIAAGALGGWRAALGGIGYALLAGLAVGYGPTLMGAGTDADRFLLDLTLLLCGGVPAVMALVREKRARPRAVGRHSAVSPSRGSGARTGASS
jgi:hypothetical protein